MGIKTTLKKISEGANALQLMLHPDVRLPAKAAYAVGKLARACFTEMEEYNKQRAKTFEAAGCTIRDEQWVHEDAQVFAATRKEVEGLLEADAEINALPLDIDAFKDAEVPGGFFGLDWAMKDTQ